MIVQISDPHLGLGPDREARADALRRAVGTIGEFSRAPAAVVVTGDLADTAHPDEYAQVTEILGGLTMPVHTIPGNHDNAEMFTPPRAVLADGLRIVLADTTIPGRNGGQLDTEWLDHILQEQPDTPTIVAMHHPPLHTGIPMLDEIGLAPGTRERLADSLRNAPQVQRVICGHVHRAMFETLGGCAVLTSPSTYLQAEPGPGAGGIRFVPRGAAIVLHHTRPDGTMVSHLQPITE